MPGILPDPQQAQRLKSIIGGYTDNDVVERLGMLPFGKYSDGRVRMAWPEVAATAGRAIWDLGDAASVAARNNDPETTAAMARQSFDAASVAPMGGVAAGMAGAVPEGAGAANGIGARIKGLFGRGQEPSAPAPGTFTYDSIPLDDAWHASPAKFDKWDTSFSGTQGGNDGYPGAVFLGSKETSGPGGAIARGGGHAYNVAVDTDGASVLELGLPFEKQAPEVQKKLLQHEGYIRAQWNNFAPSDQSRDLFFEGAQFAPGSTFKPGVPLIEQFQGYGALPGLDKMGFEVVRDPSQVAVLNPSRAKFKSRDGENLYSNSPTGASVPLAMQALEKQGALDGHSIYGTGRFQLAHDPEVGGPGFAELKILKDGVPIGTAEVLGQSADTVRINNIYTDYGSNSLGLEGLRGVREAFREMAPGVKNFVGGRDISKKTGASGAGAQNASYPDGRNQSVTMYANSGTGASVPLAFNDYDEPPKRRTRGMIY